MCWPVKTVCTSVIVSSHVDWCWQKSARCGARSPMLQGTTRCCRFGCRKRIENFVHSILRVMEKISSVQLPLLHFDCILILGYPCIGVPLYRGSPYRVFFIRRSARVPLYTGYPYIGSPPIYYSGRHNRRLLRTVEIIRRHKKDKAFQKAYFKVK